MNTDAFLLMLGANGVVTALTLYFFWRVLTAPPRKEPDSYSDNE